MVTSAIEAASRQQEAPPRQIRVWTLLDQETHHRARDAAVRANLSLYAWFAQQIRRSVGTDR